MTARTLTLARPWLGTTLPFALPIGLAAFLLFSVQPLIGRLVLPTFGGTPAVWATILFFFQATLLVGYLYGHVSVTRLGSWGPPLHLVLAALGFAALIVAPIRIADLRLDGVPPVLDLVRILVIIIGLPALVLTTTTPLVSGWFEAARSRTTDGDPYWLYALSNGGSLLALITYPLVIEPRLGLATQRGTWAVGYAALVILLALAASRAIPALRGALASAPDALAPVLIGTTRSTVTRPIDWPRRGRWLLLAAVPSGLLSAVTTFIATDLVSAPLLWVAPLSLYLLSFVIAFSPRGGRVIGWSFAASPAMITILWVPYGSAGGWPIVAVVLAQLLAFVVVATALHGRLAQDRPDPSRLTEFYLVLSLGGALASAFVGLIAPLVFPGVWELPILLVAGLVGLALVSPGEASARRGDRRLDFTPFVRGARSRLLPYLVAAGSLTVALIGSGALAAEAGVRWMVVGGMILALGGRPWFLAVVTALVLTMATFVLQPSAEFRERSFFGVSQVLQTADDLTVLISGTTVHGSQSNDPARAHIPLGYYAAEGPLGDVFTTIASRDGRREVGVAGLGSGTMATYADEQTAMTFFEIDPVVIRVATDPQLFTYVSDATLSPTIVEGDARLSFEGLPDDSFDLLVLDAFSSDSVPVHLLTAEAIADQIRITLPRGVIAFHISNRYYDLAPPIAAAVVRAGLVILEKGYQPEEPQQPGDQPSRWLAASRDPGTLAALRATGWIDVVPAAQPFTDDYADLLRYLTVGG